MNPHPLTILLILLLFHGLQHCSSTNSGPRSVTNDEYLPTWDSLDARPLPKWYDADKIGIFIHWGVFSVPGFRSEWFWHGWKTVQSPLIVDFMKKNYKPGFTYQDFGEQFTAEFYNASQWTQLFKKSGAKYVVLTSKHHEGYTLWPSKYSFSWNAMDLGAHRDLLGELERAVRTESDLKFGLYHSLYEWFNPLWIQDRDSNLTSDDFVKFKTLPELYEIVNRYQPDVVWSDGEWEASDTYWKSKEFLAWLYNDSPVKDSVVTNDRWGIGTLCKHGGYYTCADRYNPGVVQPHKWENCFTLDKQSWGYRRNAPVSEYMSAFEIVKTVVQTVSCGGNALINVGPTRDGMIVPIQEERLLQLGHWLEVNGEGIYNTVPWIHQNDTLTPGIWFTSRPDDDLVYGITLEWPPTSILHLEVIDAAQVSSIILLGSEAEGMLSWHHGNPGIKVNFPSILTNKSKWAWTLKFTTTQHKKFESCRGQESVYISISPSVLEDSSVALCPVKGQLKIGDRFRVTNGSGEVSSPPVLSTTMANNILEIETN